MSVRYTGKINNLSSGGIAVQADSTLTASSDPDLRQGWCFEKTSAGTDKFNLYYWSQANLPKTGNDIKTLKAIVSVDNYQSTLSLPFFVAYTKPKGDGTDAAVWYNARRSYSFTTTEDIETGQEIEMYAKHISDENGVRKVQFNTITDDGTWSDDDELLYLTLHSDSSAPAGTKILVKGMGVVFQRDNEIFYELIGLDSGPPPEVPPV